MAGRYVDVFLTSILLMRQQMVKITGVEHAQWKILVYYGHYCRNNGLKGAG